MPPLRFDPKTLSIIDGDDVYPARDAEEAARVLAELARKYALDEEASRQVEELAHEVRRFFERRKRRIEALNAWLMALEDEVDDGTFHGRLKRYLGSHYADDPDKVAEAWRRLHGWLPKVFRRLLEKLEGIITTRKGEKVDPAVAARIVVRDLLVFAEGEDPKTATYWAYDGRRFTPMGRPLIMRRVKQLLERMGHRLTRQWLYEFLMHLYILAWVERAEWPRHDELVNVANGVVYARTLELKPHSPYYGFTYVIRTPYDPEVDTNWVRERHEEVLGDAVDLYFKFLGYSLTQSVAFQKGLIIVGSGGEGKSTVLNAFRAVVGEENVASVSLDKIEERFHAYQLVNKLVNIYPDLPAGVLRTTGKIKAVVSGDPIEVERKYRDPFPYAPYCKHIFSANMLPKVRDLSRAFWRRWFVIKAVGRFKEVDRDMLKKLTTPESRKAILKLALEGLRRLLEEGWGAEEQVRTVELEWKRQSDPVFAFALDCVEADPQGTVTVDEAFEAFLQYCAPRGIPTVSKTVFSRELPRACHEAKGIIVLRGVKGKGKERRPTFKGIRIEVSGVSGARSVLSEGASSCSSPSPDEVSGVSEVSGVPPETPIGGPRTAKGFTGTTPETPETPETGGALSEEERRVMEALPGSLKAIAERAGMSEADVAEVLARLRARGLVEDLGGGFYVVAE